MVRYPAKAASADAMFEAALDVGAENVESDTEGHEATSAPEDFARLRDQLEAKFGAPEALEKRGIHPLSAAHEFICNTPIELPEAQDTEVLQLIDTLEDNDDVQTVSANFEVADDVLARLTA